MRSIPLSNGMSALVDDEDFALVASLGRWTATPSNRTYYARRAYLDPATRSQKQLAMHTLITGWSYVDHINGDGLDNQRSNLRESCHDLNMANKRVYRNNTSGFKGVSAKKGRWVAQIGTGISGQRRHLGYFDTPEDAARAYDVAAAAQWGEHARLNFPSEVAA